MIRYATALGIHYAARAAAGLVAAGFTIDAAVDDGPWILAVLSWIMAGISEFLLAWFRAVARSVVRAEPGEHHRRPSDALDFPTTFHPTVREGYVPVADLKPALDRGGLVSLLVPHPRIYRGGTFWVRRKNAEASWAGVDMRFDEVADGWTVPLLETLVRIDAVLAEGEAC